MKPENNALLLSGGYSVGLSHSLFAAIPATSLDMRISISDNICQARTLLELLWNCSSDSHIAEHSCLHDGYWLLDKILISLAVLVIEIFTMKISSSSLADI